MRSYAFEKIDGVTLASFPAQAVALFTETKITKIATISPTVALAADKLVKDGFFGLIAPPATIEGEKVGGTARSDIRSSISDRLGDSQTKKLGIEALDRTKRDPATDFFLAQRFFDGGGRKRVPLGVPGKGPDRRIDFHQMIALLSKHPQLMRLLGIVFDLEVEVPENRAEVIKVWVKPLWSEAMGPAPQFESLKTETNMRSFTAEPRSSPQNPDNSTPTQREIVKGRLNLANTYKDGVRVFDLTQLDTDGAALKLSRFAALVIKTLKTQAAVARNPIPRGRTRQGTDGEAEVQFETLPPRP